MKKAIITGIIVSFILSVIILFLVLNSNFLNNVSFANNDNLEEIILDPIVIQTNLFSSNKIHYVRCSISLSTYDKKIEKNFDTYKTKITNLLISELLITSYENSLKSNFQERFSENIIERLEDEIQLNFEQLYFNELIIK